LPGNLRSSNGTRERNGRESYKKEILPEKGEEKGKKDPEEWG